MYGALIYFAVGLLVCFIGTIPFGPINLSVVKITVDHSFKRGIEVAVAAALVEIVQALIALTFGMVISAYLDSNILLKLVIAAAFIILAFVVYLRTSEPTLSVADKGRSGYFLRGLLLAAINPQAIPFWIFALAAISQYALLEYSGINLLGFLFGVFVGKLLALTGFVYASNYLKTHLQQSSRLVNQILASILLLIGISQLWNVFVANWT